MDLDAIEASEKAMTPGDWKYHGGWGQVIQDDSRRTVASTGSSGLPEALANAEGIVLLRNSAREMVARIRSQAEEIKRLRRFVTDQGTTCYSCESCGHARTTRECLRCEVDRLRELCGEAAFHATNHLSLATAISYQPSDAGMAECLPDIRANRDRLRAALEQKVGE